MTTSQHGRRALAHCHGYSVVASDGPLGEVETPLFPPHGNEPDYLLVRVSRRNLDRRPVVPTGLVENIDPERRVIGLRGTGDKLADLPEYLPLVGRGPGGGPS